MHPTCTSRRWPTAGSCPAPPTLRRGGGGTQRLPNGNDVTTLAAQCTFRLRASWCRRRPLSSSPGSIVKLELPRRGKPETERLILWRKPRYDLGPKVSRLIVIAGISVELRDICIWWWIWKYIISVSYVIPRFYRAMRVTALARKWKVIDDCIVWKIFHAARNEIL